MQHGAWRRAGMAGVVVGVDFQEALRRVDCEDLHIPTVMKIAAAGEGGLLAGLARKRPES